MNKLPQANKTLGQHFLRDQNIITKITTDFSLDCDIIVEVGPGPAVLTRNLAAHKKPFFVIEKDDRFIDLLREIVGEQNVFHQDALEFDWHNFVNRPDVKGKKIWLVSNLPYNISVPLLIGFTQVENIHALSLMFQKEVGHKIINVEKIKNFTNSLGLLMENYFDLKVLCKVPPGAFVPPPKVDSIVISFKRKNTPAIALSQFHSFEQFLRDLFRFKRKQIGSVLKHLPNIGEALIKTQIPRETRAESLEAKDIHLIFHEVQTHYQRSKK